MLGAFVLFGLVEAGVSVWAGLDSRPPTYVVCEDVGDNMAFDPASGYRLSPTPWRMAQFHQGVREFASTVRGNGLGFPDDEFAARRPSPDVLRIAVFGDSFSAGTNMEVNWPRRVEELLARRPGSPRVQLLNFSLNGYGLANWWSVMEHIVAAREFELDGIVFAVWGDDFERRFFFADAADDGMIHAARYPTWRRDDYPRDRAAAQRWLLPLPMFRLGAAEFDRALAEGWTPPRRWRLVLTGRLTQSLGRSLPGLPLIGKPAVAGQTDAGSERMDHEKALVAFVKSRGLPMLGVRLPSRYELLSTGPDEHSQVRERRIRTFTRRMGGVFVDGLEAYTGLSKSELRTFYPPTDGHWNQLGSNRFADYIAGPILDLARGRLSEDG